MPAAAMAQDAPPPPPAEELNLINLPTTTSLNKHQSYFRLTHRFARDLRRGDFGSLAEDFFSLDNGAVIGLEYRFGVTSRLQAGVHRATLSKTIQFFGRYDGWRQSESLPVSISLLGSVEGLANFHQNYQPGVGAVVSRAVGTWLTLYAVPTFVAHTRAADSLSGHEGHDHDLPETTDDDHSHHDGTTFIGIGDARPHPADGLRLVGVLTARAGPRSRARRMGSRHRKTDGGPHDATELHQRVRHDVR